MNVKISAKGAELSFSDYSVMTINDTSLREILEKAIKPTLYKKYFGSVDITIDIPDPELLLEVDGEELDLEKEEER